MLLLFTLGTGVTTAASLAKNEASSSETRPVSITIELRIENGLHFDLVTLSGQTSLTQQDILAVEQELKATLAKFIGDSAVVSKNKVGQHKGCRNKTGTELEDCCVGLAKDLQGHQDGVRTMLEQIREEEDLAVIAALIRDYNAEMEAGVDAITEFCRSCQGTTAQLDYGITCN
jgi:hypothetical protein